MHKDVTPSHEKRMPAKVLSLNATVGFLQLTKKWNSFTGKKSFTNTCDYDFHSLKCRNAN